MISKFFIERPVLSNVIAILMILIGGVALVAGNAAEFAVVPYAAYLIGAIIVPVNFRLAAGEIVLADYAQHLALDRTVAIKVMNADVADDPVAWETALDMALTAIFLLGYQTLT